MLTKKILSGIESRKRLIAGANKLADAVKVTFGPKGSNVTIQREYGKPITTCDGYSVAKEIRLEDNEEEQGLKLIQSASEKTNTECGDGTSSVVILAQAIVNEGIQQIIHGHDPISIRKGIEIATDKIVDELKKISIPANTKDDIKNIATISSKDKILGKLISDVINKVGKNGYVTVEKSNTPNITSEVVSGMQVNKGYASPYFVTDTKKMSATIEKASVLVTDEKLDNATNTNKVIELLSKLLESNRREIIIIANDFSEDFLSNLILNKVNNVLDVIAIKAPGFGEAKEGALQDIAVMTGAKFLSSKLGSSLDKATLEDLGSVKKVTSTLTNTLFIEGGGKKEDIATQVSLVQGMLNRATSKFEIKDLKERLAKLSGGIGVINVGAFSDTEQSEKIDKIEDALGATNAAIEDGVVVGGGVALANISEKLIDIKVSKSEQVGVNIMKEAILSPIKQLSKNSNKNSNEVISKILENKNDNFGIDFSTGEYCDLIENGVIEPTKVVMSAIRNAVSVSLMILSTDVLITSIKEEKEKDD